MTHLAVALLSQLVAGAAFGAWWLAAAAASGFFIGREVSQAEYRNIQQHYEGKRANMPWYGGFEPRAWNRKSLLDWVLPTFAVAVVAICLT
jgi:hypothetical protein